MNCKKCGAALLPNDTFCGNCGTKQFPVSTGNTGKKAYINSAPSITYAQSEINQNNRVGYQKPINDIKNAEEKKKLSILSAILIFIIALLVLFTAFNAVIMTGVVDVPKGSLIEDYKQSLSSFLGIEEDDEYDDEEKSEQKDTNGETTVSYTENDETEVSEDADTDDSEETAAEDTDEQSGYDSDDLDDSDTDSYESSDYLFQSDKELLTEDYLDSKSKNEIDLIRNELYARHGYIFQMKEFYDYFIQKSWYNPTEPDMDKVYDSFNATEKQNIEILAKYQNLN